MAGYGGAVGGYTTPDGRVVQMPADFASQFPALRPVAPPVPLPPSPGQQIGPAPGAPPVDPGLPITAPAPMTALPLPTGPAPVWTPQDSAELVKQTVQSSGTGSGPQPAPQTGQPTAAQRGLPTPAQRGQGTAAPQGDDQTPAQPAGRRPLTDADIAKGGVAGPTNAEISAGEEKKAAIDRHAQAMADESTQVGDAMAQSEEKAGKLLEERKQEADRRQAAIDQHNVWFMDQAKKIANTKIDREHDHPWIAAIGVALGELGAAMQNRSNALAAAFRGQAAPAPIESTAMQAFYAAIDRKVNAQIASLDSQKSGLQLYGQGIERERQAMGDRLSQLDVYRAGTLEQAKMQIDRIKAQSQSPVIKAAADMMKADVSREQADALGKSQERLQTHMDAVAARNQAAQFHRESLAVTVRGQDMEQNRFDKQLAATEREKMATIAAQLLKEGKAEAAAKAKAVAEGGLFDPRTGDALLNPAGQAKFKQADQLEAAARQQQDPALAQRQKQQADELRMSAKINDSIVADPKVATKLRDHLDTAQNVTDQIGDVITKLEQDPSAFNREQWAGIATQMGNLANTYQKTIGERISVKAFDQTMKHILEFDPDSYFHREFNQSRALESLKQLKGIVAGDINSDLRAQGVKTEWTPVARGAGEHDTSLALSDKTAAERGEERSIGYANVAKYIPGVEQQAKDEEHAAYATAPGAEGGLTPNAVTHIKALAAKAASSGDAVHDQIVQSIAGSVSSGLNAGGRSGIAPGILEVLRNSAPAVYQDVVDALPESDRKAVIARDALIRKATVVPNRPSGFDPDAAASADAEARRAAASARYGRPPQNSPGAGTP